uniref:Uncharacterized protein n=1 Tax=Nelumbo nucifera TaxID=4432 RepID=A0A822YC48_NELNU|nr:TPA_asm: hypothetical protein HUJ06_031340 [Nelumbo nucifera]
MDKNVASSLFVNDGSFMERFKQLQQEKEKEAALEQSKSGTSACASGNLKANPPISKMVLDSKANDARRATPSGSGGKLAFSLKQKSKLAAAPVRLCADEDEEGDAGYGSADGSVKRQKLAQPDASEWPAEQEGVGNYCLYSYPFIWFSWHNKFTLSSSLALKSFYPI